MGVNGRNNGNMGSKTSKTRKKDVEVLMPIYLYPNEENMNIYRRVVKRNVPMTVIINPNNGSDAVNAPNSDWRKVVKATQHVNTVGYVHLSYMKRDISLVKKEIQGYARNGWNVGGIFFDETPSDRSRLEVIRELSEFTREIFDKDDVKIFLNPGVPVHEKYFELADGIVIFEDFHSHFDPKLLLLRCDNSASTKSAVIIRGVPDKEIKSIMNELKHSSIGYVFMTALDCEYHTPVDAYFFEKITREI